MKTRKPLVALVFLMVVVLLISRANAATSGTSTGTATVTSAAPTIANVELWDAAESTDKNNTALDSNNVEYRLNFTISDANTMAELKNVTVIAWDNRGQIEGDVDSQRYHYTWTWVESTDTWSCPLSANYIVGGSCADPGTGGGGTSYEFRLAFKLSKVANYSNAGTYDGWQVKIYVYDDGANSANFGQGAGGRIQFGVASYLGITITDTTHSWSAGPNTNDNAVSAGGDGKVDFTILANRLWKIQASGDRADLNTSTPLRQFGLGNVTQYGSNSVGDSVSVTQSYVDVTGLTGQAAPTDEASPTNTGVYLWLDVPNGQESDTYTYVLNVQVASG